MFWLACFVGFWHVWARFRVFASFRPALACFIVLRHVYFFGLCNFVMFRHVLFSGMFNHVLACFACFLLLLHIFTCCSMHISGQVLVSFFVIVASVDVRQAGPDCSWAALTWNQRQAFARIISSLEWPTVHRSRSKRYSYHVVLLWSLWPKQKLQTANLACSSIVSPVEIALA
jgi:hypothetical protein